MARRITITLNGQTDAEKEYIKEYLSEHKPEGYDVSDSSISVYAANCYDPEVEKYLKKISRDLRKKSLDYVLEAEVVGYDRYEVSAAGVYYIGGYEVVDLDPDGCGPIKEYKATERRKVA